MTDQVRLEAFGEDDFDLLASWFDNARALAEWGGTRLTFPLDHAQLSAMVMRSRGERPEWPCYKVMQGDQVIGHGQLVLDRADGIARLCRIALAPKMRGKGLSRPLLACLVDEALKDPAIERLELNVYDFNEAAIRAYQAFGFRLEGVRRSSARFADARWNTAMMGLLRPQWENRAKKGDRA